MNKSLKYFSPLTHILRFFFPTKRMKFHYPVNNTRAYKSSISCAYFPPVLQRVFCCRRTSPTSQSTDPKCCVLTSPANSLVGPPLALPVCTVSINFRPGTHPSVHLFSLSLVKRHALPTFRIQHPA